MNGKETHDVVALDGTVVLPAARSSRRRASRPSFDSDAKEIHIRNNNVRGIAVEAIKEGDGIIESLAERIVGRFLAENIDDSGDGRAHCLHQRHGR